MKSPQAGCWPCLRALSWIWLAVSTFGCTVEPTTSIQDRPSAGSQSVIDSEWYNACHSYCGQMYNEPEGCDEDQVEIEATACHLYCDLGSDTLTEPCRAALIAVYECIFEQQVPYACTSNGTSPQSTEDTCDGEWEVVNSC